MIKILSRVKKETSLDFFFKSAFKKVLLIRHKSATQSGVCVCVHARTHQLTLVVSSSAALWTVACQAPLSMGFSRQQAWVAISCSRGSSQPRDRTRISCVSCIGNWVLYHQHQLGCSMIHLSAVNLSRDGSAQWVMKLHQNLLGSEGR